MSTFPFGGYNVPTGCGPRRDVSTRQASVTGPREANGADLISQAISYRRNAQLLVEVGATDRSEDKGPPRHRYRVRPPDRDPPRASYMRSQIRHSGFPTTGCLRGWLLSIYICRQICRVWSPSLENGLVSVSQARQHWTTAKAANSILDERGGWRSCDIPTPPQMGPVAGAGPRVTPRYLSGAKSFGRSGDRRAKREFGPCNRALGRSISLSLRAVGVDGSVRLVDTYDTVSSRLHVEEKGRPREREGKKKRAYSRARKKGSGLAPLLRPVDRRNFSCFSLLLY